VPAVAAESAVASAKTEAPIPVYAGGARRSVFDLLKEKHPDLAPPPAKSAKAEPPKVEARKAEPPKIEPPKVEAPKPEPPKVEARKPEPPKVEAPKPEPPKVEARKPEPPKVEAPKPEPPKVEPPKVETPPVAPPVAAAPAPAEKAKSELAETAALASVLALRQAAVEQKEPSAPTPVAPAMAAPAVAAPKPAALKPAAPKPAALKPAAPRRAALGKRFAGWRPRPKVAAFWLGLASLLALGAYGLASLKPGKPRLPEAAAVTAEAVPEDSAAATLSARELTLEPEQVVVKPPGAGVKPQAAVPVTPPKPTPKPPTRAEKREAARKAAEEKKKNDSQIVIEQVPPVVAPVRTGGRQPEYPVEARAAGLEGTVVLFGVVDRAGKVKNARVVRGLSPPLDAAALAAFRTWRFKPATQKGKKVEFKYNAGIEFRINSPAEQVAAPQVAEAPPAAGQPAATPPETPATLPAAAPPPAAAAPLAYGGEFTPPVRITMVWPQKPQGAQMVKGEVKLQLAVGADGSVREVEVLEGLPQGVTEAAIEAVRQWKFKPARQSGEPVAVYHRVSLRF
jgi:TonB family protein